MGGLIFICAFLMVVNEMYYFAPLNQHRVHCSCGLQGNKIIVSNFFLFWPHVCFSFTCAALASVHLSCVFFHTRRATTGGGCDCVVVLIISFSLGTGYLTA